MLTRHQLGICANGDPATFEQAVRDLCGDEEFRMRLGDNGRKYVMRHHGTGPIAELYTELLLELAGRRLERPTAEVDAPIPDRQPDPVLERKVAGGRR